MEHLGGGPSFHQSLLLHTEGEQPKTEVLKLWYHTVLEVSVALNRSLAEIDPPTRVM